MIRMQAILLWLLLSAGRAQQFEEHALQLHLTEQALVREVRSQAGQIAEGPGLTNLSGPLSILGLLEAELANLKGRDPVNESDFGQNKSIREEAGDVECTTDQLLVELSEVVEATEQLILTRKRTLSLQDAVRRARQGSKKDAGGGGLSCGERRRLRRRLQQLQNEERGIAAEKADLGRLLATMRVHVDRIQEEAWQGERALNATRALQELARKNVLKEEHSYQKVLEELTHLNEVLHGHRQEEHSVFRNRSIEVQRAGEHTKNSTQSFGEHGSSESPGDRRGPLHLLVAAPDNSDESFQKGRREAKKPPCRERVSSLPGRVDSVDSDGEPAALGRTPKLPTLSEEPTRSPTTTAAATTTVPSSVSSTQHTVRTTQPAADDTEPESDLPNHAVHRAQDPAIDTAADEEPASTPPPPKPSTSLPRPRQIHEETWPVKYEDGERIATEGSPHTASTTRPSAPGWYEEPNWEASPELWSKQEQLAWQLANLSQRWEIAKNRSRGLLKAHLVADDALRQMRAAVNNHFKATDLVGKQFNFTKVKLSKLRGRAKIASDALARQPRCHAAERRKRLEELESKMKQAEGDIERRQAQLQAIGRVMTSSWRQLQAGLVRLRLLGGGSGSSDKKGTG